MRRRRRRFLLATFALMCVSAAAYALVETNGAGNDARTAEISPRSTSEETTVKEVAASRPERPPLPPPEESCDDLRVLVGKTHELPPTYEPKDLVSLMAYGVPTYGSDQFVRQGVLNPLSKLVADAATDGHELVVISAYRSYAEQEQNFAHFTGIYGADAEIVSAPPGQSQHQLGTTVDFTNAEVGYQLLPTFGETGAGRWLENNAWKYGFIITYPNGDEAGTGRQWEPWEYRFVGEKTAREVHESGLSLREFLVEEGVRPRC